MSRDEFTTPSSNLIPNPQQLPPPAKKKRNLPGTPDPEAEVIALSPKSLMATNRFVCEICNKGFQRDQNLQLHRRGHNLPWKLRQRVPGKEARKRVYICPEPGCVHHDPSRALGDLTGIKKHFSRKHGEKKWKCDRCSKKYAVRSDWKAHSKTCGTREYKCDCGTVFSRKDSFITHRAFCDALTQESTRLSILNYASEDKTDLSLWQDGQLNPSPDTNFIVAAGSMGLPELEPMASANATIHSSLSAMDHSEGWHVPTNLSEEKGGTSKGSGGMVESLASLYSINQTHQFGTTTAAHLSATALLQKAAQMGAAISSSSSSTLFAGLMGTMKSKNGSKILGKEKAFGGFQDVMLSNVGGLMTGQPGWGEEARHGATRDFLGLGGEGSGQTFQELAKFSYMGSGVDLI